MHKFFLYKKLNWWKSGAGYNEYTLCITRHATGTMSIRAYYYTQRTAIVQSFAPLTPVRALFESVMSHARGLLHFKPCIRVFLVWVSCPIQHKSLAKYMYSKKSYSELPLSLCSHTYCFGSMENILQFNNLSNLFQRLVLIIIC